MSFGIKKFIKDFEFNSKYKSRKLLFRDYFIRGNFKKGFTLLFSGNSTEDYYFQLDSADIAYLVNKYKPIYEDILMQEKENEIKLTKEHIENLNKKLKELNKK